MSSARQSCCHRVGSHRSLCAHCCCTPLQHAPPPALPLVPLQLALVLLMITGVHFVEAYGLNPAIYSAHLKLHPLLVLTVLVVAEHSLGVWGLLLAVPLTVFALDYVVRYPQVGAVLCYAALCCAVLRCAACCCAACCCAAPVRTASQPIWSFHVCCLLRGASVDMTLRLWLPHSGAVHRYGCGCRRAGKCQHDKHGCE